MKILIMLFISCISVISCIKRHSKNNNSEYGDKEYLKYYLDKTDGDDEEIKKCFFWTYLDGDFPIEKCHSHTSYIMTYKQNAVAEVMAREGWRFFIRKKNAELISRVQKDINEIDKAKREYMKKK